MPRLELVPGNPDEEGTEAFGMRITHRLRYRLYWATKYIGALTPSDLVRSWAIEHADEIWSEKRFQEWLEKQLARQPDPNQARIAQ